MRTQLDHQITEMRSLRDSLETGDSQRRLLQDERGDILRKVSSLHSDLDRVRQDALSLGTDLTNLRKEREQGRNPTSGAGSVELQAELEIIRKRLEISERKVSQHVCLSYVISSLYTLPLLTNKCASGMRMHSLLHVNKALKKLKVYS